MFLMNILDSRLIRKIYGLAWPVIIEYFMTSLYTLIDTFFVAKLGVADVAGLGGGGYIAWMFWVPGFMLTTGVMVLIAQSLGAGKRELARRVYGESVILALAISLPVVFLGVLVAEDVVRIVVAGPEVTVKGTQYLVARLLGLPAMYIFFTVGAALRGAKDTKTPMTVSILGNIFNIILDPILIFGLLGLPKLGVFGAGLASSLSFYFMLMFYIVLGVKGRLVIMPRIKALTVETLRKILYLGLPISIERILMSGLMLIYVSMIARFGSVSLAAHQIGLRIESLVFMPGIAFRIATATLVGHEIGGKNIDKAKEIINTATKLSLMFMSITGFSLVALSWYIPVLFIDNVEVHRLSTIYLILAGSSEPGLGVAFAMIGAFHGAGNTLVPVIVSAISNATVRLGLGWTLGKYYGLGAIGLWTGMFLDVYVRGIVLYVLYRKRFERFIKVLV
ncbi:MAG: hypothetical protein DRO23_03725 [Thermoprotei archaeon]|nr:MAG: hypothetical protein DRO23_03725 [Thermoprotei archaeon]